MKLATCIVVHDRLELTLATIASYLRTTTDEHKLLVIVDSGSQEPETLHALGMLGQQGALVSRFDANVYPGRACNHGWELALRLAPDITHLHRSDNDVEYLPGWVDEVEAAFTDPTLGQLGLLEERFEQGCSNVGGNSIIRRDLWDAGLRWREEAWEELPGEQVRATEDCYLSGEVTRHGYRVGRVGREVIIHHGWDWDAYPGYYEESARARGYEPDWLREHFDRMRAL